jgi:hypothetical protein
MGSVIFWIVLALIVLLQVVGMLRLAALFQSVYEELGVAPLKSLSRLKLVVHPVSFLIGASQLFPSSKGLESGMRLGIAMNLQKNGEISDLQLAKYVRWLNDGERK